MIQAVHQWFEDKVAPAWPERSLVMRLLDCLEMLRFHGVMTDKNEDRFIKRLSKLVEEDRKVRKVTEATEAKNKNSKYDDTGSISLSVNGHTLTGQKQEGAWSFVCLSWPDLATAHHGAASTDAIMTEFMERCLAMAVEIKAKMRKARRK